MASAAATLQPLVPTNYMPKSAGSPLPSSYPTSPLLPWQSMQSIQTMLNAQMYPSYQGYPLSPSYATHPPQVVHTLADQRKQLAGIQVQVTSVQTPLYWFGFSDFEDFERKLSHAVAFLQMQPATSALSAAAPPVVPSAAAAGAPGAQGAVAAPDTPGSANP